MSQSKVSSKAGIVESKTGERHIPSSIRADGTKRKEIKIRPGYKPIEDVEIYKNRYVQIYNSFGNNEVPGAQGLNETKDKHLVVTSKNAKKRAAKKKSKSKQEEIIEEDLIDLSEDVCQKAIKHEADMETTQDISDVSKANNITRGILDIEIEKKARSLKKKLKQAKELEEKRDKGSDLLPEQLTKILRINELVRELNDLELRSKNNECKENLQVSYI
ncbi:Partner of Y14 and mago [Erysiphe neolycopersici]|uniref:Partner of Y14 and mago n=1 Tax=Erysiphe neolycopersici TaxID=212602 RepID=A0A420HSQ5_9PEZI|nr:Partner of Y14 and mago [Erysiphe neolycopersici]